MGIKMGNTRNNKLAIPCEFDSIIPAIVDDKESNEIYITKSNYLYGVARVPINYPEEASSYTEPKYTEISNFSNGIAIVKAFSISKGTKYGIINEYSAEMLECEYDYITWLSGELLLIQKNGKCGLYNIGRFREYIPCDFSKIEVSINKDGAGKKIILEI